MPNNDRFPVICTFAISKDGSGKYRYDKPTEEISVVKFSNNIIQKLSRLYLDDRKYLFIYGNYMNTSQSIVYGHKNNINTNFHLDTKDDQEITQNIKQQYNNLFNKVETKLKEQYGNNINIT